MNNKLLLAILIVLLVVGATFFIRTSQNSYDGGVVNDGSDDLPGNSEQSGLPPVNNSGDSASGTTGGDSSGKISVQELANHGSESDCWVVYNGKIYDITSYLPRHPGTAGRIAPYCGTTDFQQAFTNKHGTSKVSLLMKVGTFIGDFDVVGNLASPSNSSIQNENLALDKSYNDDGNEDYEDGDEENEYEDEEEEYEDDEDRDEEEEYDDDEEEEIEDDD